MSEQGMGLMATKLDDVELRALFSGSFRELAQRGWLQWLNKYVKFLAEVRSATEKEWLEPEFQKRLWDENPIADIKQGNAVKIEAAYADKEIALLTLRARDEPLPGSVLERGARLQEMFDELLNLALKHTGGKKPYSRALRLLAALFPHDITSLVTDTMISDVSRILGLKVPSNRFVIQHALVREAVRKVLGTEETLESEVEQSIFVYFLLEHSKKPADTLAPIDTVESKAFRPASWIAVQERINASKTANRLELPEGMMAELHSALHATGRKRFVLLAGLSGTGKTSIARAYAEAYCSALNVQDLECHYRLIAVRPDWTDPSGLLGYTNPITETESYQPGEALGLLLRANENRSKPYFLCLDEMNLARVEHYFAPFLSAMEGEEGWLSIHSDDRPVGLVPPRIEWPTNLFILGTVNMDESTHPFSDKVLDRAFVLEFWEVNLSAWEKRRRAGGAHEQVLDNVALLLKNLHATLLKVRRQFGYRVADEVLGFCSAGREAGVELNVLLDAAVLSKVLPRLRGDDSGPLKAVLDELLGNLPAVSFPRSRRKLEEMVTQLTVTGQTRFWA